MAAVVNPSSRLGQVLSWEPLRWTGVRSYGIYLWQWPVIVLINPHHGSLGVLRAVIAVAITLAIASLSWRYVEDPIRQGALGRLWKHLQARRGRPYAARRRLALSGTVFGVMFIPLLALSGVLPALSQGDQSRRTAAHTIPTACRRARVPTRRRARPIRERRPPRR